MDAVREWDLQNTLSTTELHPCCVGVCFSRLWPKVPKQWVFNKGQNDYPEVQEKKHFFPFIPIYEG